MKDLYPEIEPKRKIFLKVGKLHTLYVEESGNPNGVPVIYLHGGPGSGSQPKHRRYFDPLHYRIIVFDQRGCGLSTPRGCLEQNTTQFLVADLEAIRKTLGIERWIIFGGSWGSLLALVYGVAHPKRVLGFILFGVFFGESTNTRWLLDIGANCLFPDAWDALIKEYPKKKIGKLYSDILSPDRKVALRASKIWFSWEGSICALQPGTLGELPSDEFILNKSRIESSFFKKKFFIKNKKWLETGVRKLKKVPLHIIQGRYDLVCPPTYAWRLHKMWSGSTLEFIPDAGHISNEPGTRLALVKAAEKFKEIKF